MRVFAESRERQLGLLLLSQLLESLELSKLSLLVEVGEVLRLLVLEGWLVEMRVNNWHVCGDALLQHLLHGEILLL